MSNNKVTMRDIAKECGVSVAAVSHTLNHSGKENISDSLRLKIIETATRMKYDTTALKVRPENMYIGVIVNLNPNDPSGKKFLYYDLAAELSKELTENGFHAELIISNSVKDVIEDKHVRKMDAWFMIDIDNKEFARHLDGFYAPVILFDCHDEQQLYCKISPDYKTIVETAHKELNCNKVFLLIENIKSIVCREEITSYFSDRDVFINKKNSSLENFLAKHDGYKGIAFGEPLAERALRIIPGENLYVVSYTGMKEHYLQKGCRGTDIPNSLKAELGVKALKEMLAYSYVKGNEENRILLKP